MQAHHFTLTITCPDSAGIVAGITSFLTGISAFITESGHFSDPTTQLFFMRCEFYYQKEQLDEQQFSQRFKVTAEKFSLIWALHDKNKKPRLAILVSQHGHCLNDLLHRVESGSLAAEVTAVLSNHLTFKKRVEWHGIPFVMLDKQTPFNTQITKYLNEVSPDLVVLARYMQILSPEICAQWSERIINIHHSFLPSFKGAKPYEQAHARGVKLIGATAHYVTDALDEGPIIHQAVERIDHTFTPEKMVSVGRDIETIVLARSVQAHLEQRVFINKNKTVVF